MTECPLGVAATSYLSVWQTIDTLEFLERCHRFGAAGIHAVLNRDPVEIRARAEQLGMYVEAMVPLPLNGDTAEFERSLKNAEAAGAVALRAACLGTRRYETFVTFDAWQAHVAASYQSLEEALPLLEKYKIPLGLENHKDWTTDEFLAILNRFSSEYLGVCLDFGNNIALLDMPMDTIEKLAPYAVTTHVKDVAVEPYSDGIAMMEVVLGTGYIDLQRAVGLIHEHRPQTRMNLETITRDPLKVPMLLDSYWTTFPDKTGLDLARTLRFVNEHAGPEALPRVSQLDSSVLLKIEDQNVIDCLSAWKTL